MSVIKHTFILIVLLILLGIIYIFRSAFTVPAPVPVVTNPNDDGNTIVCTMDAMICPDGTAVGRSGPNCQFVCPSSPATGSSTTGSTSLYEAFTFRLNESKTVNHTTIKAWAVTQDSRCPSDVQCIQAGKVTVAFNLSSPAGDMTRELTIGDTLEVGSLIFTLKDVQPYPLSTKKIQDSEYRFVMDVKGK